MSRILLPIALLCAVASLQPAYADSCTKYLATLASPTADVAYWDGKQLVRLQTRLDTTSTTIFFPATRPPTAADLKLPSAMPTQHLVTQSEQGPCPKLMSIDVPRPQSSTPMTVTSAVAGYREIGSVGGTGFHGNSLTATSVATEAVQILGQIVVDRASQAAYTLLATKVQTWLKCPKSPTGGGNENGTKSSDATKRTSTPSETTTTFPATCALLSHLRLQDLAMAPNLLRQSLAADLIAKVPRDDTVVVEVVTQLLTQIVPLLGRPGSAESATTAQALAQQLVDRGLALLPRPARGTDNVKDELCRLPTHKRIVALAATAVATCEVTSQCDVMATVSQVNADCSTPLPAAKVAYAESVSGHVWDALTLQQPNGQPDVAKRLIAALDGGFEIACMYTAKRKASKKPNTAPYTCNVENKHDGLQSYEWVAILRDVSIAAVNGDGAGLANAVMVAVGRILPPADDKSASKGLRVLATVTAYATTYTGSDPTGSAAHQERTKLLESLTSEMTDRTNRGDEWIFSVGGSLGLVAGARVSHQYHATSSGTKKRDTAAMPMLSLPLGFALDWLASDAPHGFHAGLGILDIGQYVSFDQDGSVTTPDLVAAISPSITLAYAWGNRQTPFLIGATAGYTPNFDFGSPDAHAKKGAFNIGVTLGVYVPLFDFN